MNPPFPRILELQPHTRRHTNTPPHYHQHILPEHTQAAKVDCHFADLRDIDVPRGWDGVHPTDEGQSVIGV